MSDQWMDSLLFAFPPCKEPKLLNPIVLAYVGDAVYEIFIRQYLVSLPNHRPHHLHREAIQLVSARAQAKALKHWIPVLNDEELNIMKRGRNAKSGSSPKNADILEYRHSTAFECLIGYLYYKQQYKRLQELLNMTLQKNELEDK